MACPEKATLRQGVKTVECVKVDVTLRILQPLCVTLFDVVSVLNTVPD